jgi:hypothetical protein
MHPLIFLHLNLFYLQESFQVHEDSYPLRVDQLFTLQRISRRRILEAGKHEAGTCCSDVLMLWSSSFDLCSDLPVTHFNVVRHRNKHSKTSSYDRTFSGAWLKVFLQ